MTLSNNYWKILFSFFIIFLILVSFFGWATYAKTKEQIEVLLTERYQDNLSKTISFMEDSLRRVEVDLLQLAEKSSVLNYKLMKNRGEYVDELLNLQEALRQLKVIHPIGDSFYYYEKKDNVIISDYHGSYPFNEYYDTQWYELYNEINSSNKLIRLPIREDRGVFYYTIIYSGQDFMLVANLNTEKIYKQMQFTSPYLQERILISDSKGYLIHSNFPYATAMEQNTNLRELISNLQNSTGVFQKKIFEDVDFIVIQKSEYIDWYFLMTVPLKKIAFQWNNFRKVILVNLIPLGIIGIILVILLVFLIYGPYNQLADSLRKTYHDYGHNEKNAFDYIRKILDSDISRIADLEDMVNLYKETTGQKILIDFLEEMISLEHFLNKSKGLDIYHINDVYRFILISGSMEDDFEIEKTDIYLLPVHGDVLIIESTSSGKDWNFSLDFLKKYNGLISDNIYDISHFPRIYEMMMNNLEYVKFYNLQGFYPVTKFENLGNDDFLYPEDLERKLLNKIQSGDYQASLSIIDELFILLQENEFLDLWIFRRVVVRMLFAMLKQLPFKKAMEFDVLQNTILKKNIDELKITLNSMCLDITTYLQNLNQASESNIYTQRAKTYIDEHFQRDISLDDIANHLKISYPYLSKIFKEGADENILYYINKKRIEKSKELLVRTDKTMQEIALEIGYNNTQSFSRYFKKREGISPGKYKKIKIDEP